MTKYPVTYYSESKKKNVDIESMATPHLMNAWRKAGGTMGVNSDNVDLLTALADEIKSRGGTYNPEADRWELPPKPEEATS